MVASSTFDKLSYMEPYMALVVHVRLTEAMGCFKSTHCIAESTIEAVKAHWDSLPVNWEGDRLDR